MVNTEKIERIIATVLASGKLKDEKPLSLIIVAPVEAGKTSVIKKVCLKYDHALYLTDATAYGIISASNNLEDFATGRLTHLVIPDLITPLSRKRDVVNQLIAFLNNLIEDGCVEINTYMVSIRRKVHVRAGLITAVPRQIFFDRRRRWEAMGFLSRALVVSFEYSPTTIIEIFKYIKQQRHLHENFEKFNFSEKPLEVALNPDIADSIEPYTHLLAANMAKYQKLYGFRLQKQLQTFIKAIALLQGKKEVDHDCLDEFKNLFPYLNLNFEKI